MYMMNHGVTGVHCTYIPWAYMNNNHIPLSAKKNNFFC